MEEVTTKSGMSVGMVVGIAVLVALVFGGGAYAYVNNKATKEKNDLNAQITDLQKQVATSGTIAATTTPSSSTSTPASATDKTAGWKTYTNNDYGYSFKYPADWSAQQSSSQTSTNCKTICASASFSGSNSFWTQVTDLDEFASSIQNGTFTDKSLLGYVRYSQSKDGLTETTVNDNAVVKMKTTNLDDSNGYSTGFFLLKNSKIYAVYANYSKTDTSSGDILNSILSTFQFTK